ncbi:MAG: 5-methyltetrahydropteroyltriglutamate--homocysteine S-methyltransferase, partial [Pseudorhodoplanes sp.]
MNNLQKDLPRADHVGSLLRPQALRRAHQQYAAKEIDGAALEKVVASCITDAVRHQEDAGLQVVTDGEFRRGSWFLGFVQALDGIELKKVELQFTVGGEHTASWFGPVVTGKLARKRPIVTLDYEALAPATSRRAKVTLPTPSILHFFGGKDGVSKTAYPDIEEFAADLTDIYREEIAALYHCGCRFVQIDEVALALLCDDTIRASLKAQGEDPDRLTDLYFRMIEAALSEKPVDLMVSMHLCRGNYKGRWMGSGGYDRIAERLLNTKGVDAYLLEYDSERAGTFEPLKYVPAGRRAYLGIVSSKSGDLENLDLLRKRLDEAEKVAPAERLGVSPQCGFASSAGGNPLSEAEQWKKLAR